MTEPVLEIDDRGIQFWYLDGDLHREDGPAIIYPEGGERWGQRGKLHREDGPAVTWTDGSQQWWLNGKLHREDGPAIIWGNGTYMWCLNGRYYTFTAWLAALDCDDQTRTLLVLKWSDHSE